MQEIMHPPLIAGFFSFMPAILPCQHMNLPGQPMYKFGVPLWLFGGPGDDYLHGGYDNDLLFGGDGNDELLDNSGSNEFYGEAGDDSLTGTYGDDLFDAGPGTNTHQDKYVTASSQYLTIPQETPLAITLTAIDPQSDPLTYTIVSQPTHGTLTGSGRNMVYWPEEDFSGLDSFVFKANDSEDDSNLAVVAINLTPSLYFPYFNAVAEVHGVSDDLEEKLCDCPCSCDSAPTKADPNTGLVQAEASAGGLNFNPLSSPPGTGTAQFSPGGAATLPLIGGRFWFDASATSADIIEPSGFPMGRGLIRRSGSRWPS